MTRDCSSRHRFAKHARLCRHIRGAAARTLGLLLDFLNGGIQTRQLPLPVFHRSVHVVVPLEVAGPPRQHVDVEVRLPAERDSRLAWNNAPPHSASQHINKSPTRRRKPYHGLSRRSAVLKASLLRSKTLCIIVTLYLHRELQALGGEAAGDGAAHALRELPRVAHFCGQKVGEELAVGTGGDEDVAGHMQQVSHVTGGGGEGTRVRTTGRRLTNAKERAVTANTVEGWMTKGPNAKEAGGDGGAAAALAADDEAEDATSRLRLDMTARTGGSKRKRWRGRDTSAAAGSFCVAR
jgi:hypothetical protein